MSEVYGFFLGAIFMEGLGFFLFFLYSFQNLSFCV